MPSSVKTALGQMPEDKQTIFGEEYSRKAKSKLLFILLTIFFPIYYFLLDKIGLGLLFVFSFGGFMIWWAIDIFRIPGVIGRMNEESAKKVQRDIKIIGT